jgi:uncharacterized membrane protein YfcA
MVLSEETPDSVTFRFKGRRWALATLIPGAILVAIAGNLYLSSQASRLLLAILGIFGLLLIYSSIYSATSNQWLAADGKRRSIAFFKKNLYGLVHWERTAGEFQEIKVWRHLRASNWQITLVCKDGYDLHLGENAFGSFTRDGALAIAGKVSSRTGIPIDAQNER